MSVVHVVILPISDVESLPPPQRAKRQSELARVALRRCAELAGAPLEGWTKNANDVPQPQHGWHWSIAHKPTMAVAAIARVPVGVDVERIVPRRNEGLFDHVADEDEWRIMGGRSWHSFYRLWTAKEAVLKANGVGIGSLGKCRIVYAAKQAAEIAIEGHRWHVSHCDCFMHLVGLAISGDSIVSAMTGRVGDLRYNWEQVNQGNGQEWRVRGQAEIDRIDAYSELTHSRERNFRLLRNYPEYTFLPLIEDVNDASIRMFSWREGIGAALLFIPVSLVAKWIGALSGYGLPIEIATLVMLLLPLLYLLRRIETARIRRRLREYLFDHGVAICLECGYDLRGQVEPRCPECGWRVQRAGSAEANDR